MTKETILNYLSSHKHLFYDKYGIEKIGLFGSFSRDEATEKSDVDIVIHTHRKSLKNRMACKHEIENDLKIRVDLGYFDSLRSFIKDEIKKDLIYV